VEGLELGVHYRGIVKHSAVYGLAHVFIRAASFLLLPFYTRYLRPADYGRMAILDLTASLLALLFGSGVAAAASRYHFEARDDAERDRVWWTALTLVVLLVTAIVVPAFLSRDALASATLGPEFARGGFFYALVLPTLWFGTVAEVGNSYVRVRKWSTFFVGLIVSRLTLNVILNVYFLVALRMGIAGILLGNLIVSGLNAAILVSVLATDRGRFVPDLALARSLVWFGGPLAVSSLLVVVMNQADRYLLRLFVPMDQVGIYALAYTIGEGVSTLLLAPFVSIWSVAVYELARHPDAKAIYARVFRYYVELLMLAMLGLSLFARPIMGLMAARDFAAAADLIPVIGLAYVFFSLTKHFEVPALLAKRTVSLLPASFAAAVLNIVLTLALVPLMGTAGAAWATVMTFVIYSFIGLWIYRRIDRYDYPLARCGCTLLGMVVTYVSWRLVGQLTGPNSAQIAVAAVIWVAWAVALFWPIARPLMAAIGPALASWSSRKGAVNRSGAMNAREGA
jgi:O-antigen/teichoic acid export membrane protein